ncbi:MAG: DUF3102 domain-containing protein [Leptospiraceae bacterium]|nr:DUF3102 domain-containing protein [Leptospiraceae bacterium]
MNDLISLESIRDIENRNERIEILHKSILSMQLRTFEFGVMIGKELSEQKAELPHGHFIKWLNSNVPFISRMTANRYIRVYENQDMLREKLGENLELKKAYNLLSKKTEKPINPKNKTEVLKNKLDEHLKNSITDNRQKIALAKRKVLKGETLKKREKKLLEKDTIAKREKVKKAIERAEARLQKLEELLEKL